MGRSTKGNKGGSTLKIVRRVIWPLRQTAQWELIWINSRIWTFHSDAEGPIEGGFYLRAFQLVLGIGIFIGAHV